MLNLRETKVLVRQTIASTANQFLSAQEKYIKIPIVDNKELRKDLIARIEAVTLKIIEHISTGQAPYISYFSDQNVISKSSVREENVYPECSVDPRTKTMSFNDNLTDFAEEQEADDGDNPKNPKNPKNSKNPKNPKNPKNSGKTIVDFAVKSSRNKFVLMVVLMAEAHRLLLTNTAKTRRSFYYDLKNETTDDLVPNQRYVDRTLNDVANLLECAPWDLRLLATAKGLVAGNMTITLVDNQVIDCTISGGAQIPQIISNVTSIRLKADFVLVIEKDAVFQKLLEENCTRALGCILVTGKGYPDVATRMLVKMLSEKMDLPVYIVVDPDPFGVDIMLIYRFGSSTLRKENETLACPNARWLGIHPSELITLGAKTIPLTNADLVRLRSIEARSYVNEAISKQLSILRKGKAEIEAVSSFAKNFFTATYLSYKIDGQDYI
ncbi:meiotic recombination protein W68 [Temnothorax curvispinosus]|uniref:DNA topoisomerase (ATP-hydrolyzing) n=1 Tax=Temnothorax curvispinosus TaxID=300111 RepID=A0A6J1RBP1_9HYME|nr:meiotic recombination protein W68 [Temnothorax curvispinosus]